jgi:hypothetical protein
MVLKHFVDLSLVLSSYIMISVACFGWGRAGALALTINVPSINPTFTTIWLGFSVLLLLFQIVHLFLPLDWRISLLVYLTGVLFSVPTFLRTYKRRDKIFISDRLVYVLIILISASFVASFAMLPPVNGDSGIYHFNSIRWINSYHIVPGLGNLHGRLAFNQSFFTFVASLNFFPYFPHGHNVANSYLFCLVFSQVIWQLFSAIRFSRTSEKLDPASYLPALFILANLVSFPFGWNGLSDPSPDPASVFLQIYMFMMFYTLTCDARKGRWNADTAIVVIIVAVTSVTIKLSNVGFSMGVIIVCLAWLYIFSPDRIFYFQKMARLATVSGAIIAVWVVSGYILSGYPFYPATIGALPTDWTIPLNDVQNMANCIRSWARLPGLPYDKVLGNWDWLRPWFMMLFRDSDQFVMVVYPTICTILALLCLLVISLFVGFRRKHSPSNLDLVVLVPPVLGIVFWFFTAPAPRFGFASFWLLSIASSVILLSSLYQILSPRSFLVVLCVILLVTKVNFFTVPIMKFKKNYVSASMVTQGDGVVGRPHEEKINNLPLGIEDQNKDINDPRWWRKKKLTGLLFRGFQDIPVVPLVQKKTLSGLIIHTPATVDSDKCWDSPIPSAPYFNPNLRLRIPDKIDSGFLAKK